MFLLRIVSLLALQAIVDEDRAKVVIILDATTALHHITVHHLPRMASGSTTSLPSTMG
jgi:hypothetical protein